MTSWLNKQPPPATMPDDASVEFTLRMVQAPLEGRTLPRHQRVKGHTWPIDPPPVLELVSASTDPEELFFIHNPNWFCLAELVCIRGARSPQRAKNPDDKEKEIGVAGSWSSSLHKVRGGPDPNDKQEHGYFVFGDINVRTAGQYKLKFTLFEMRRHDGQIYATRLHSIMSEPILVRSQKTESVPSTRFSRLLSEAGVKVKLRAEVSSKRRGPKTDWSSKLQDSIMRPLHLAPLSGPFLATPPLELSGRHQNNAGVDVGDRVAVEHVPLSAMGISPVIPLDNHTRPSTLNCARQDQQQQQQLPSPPQPLHPHGWAHSVPPPMQPISAHYNAFATTAENVQYPAMMTHQRELSQDQLYMSMQPPRTTMSQDTGFGAGQGMWYPTQQLQMNFQRQQQHSPTQAQPQQQQYYNTRPF